MSLSPGGGCDGYGLNGLGNDSADDWGFLLLRGGGDDGDGSSGLLLRGCCDRGGSASGKRAGDGFLLRAH